MQFHAGCGRCFAACHAAAPAARVQARRRLLAAACLWACGVLQLLLPNGRCLGTAWPTRAGNRLTGKLSSLHCFESGVLHVNMWTNTLWVQWHALDVRSHQRHPTAWHCCRLTKSCHGCMCLHCRTTKLPAAACSSWHTTCSN